MASSSFNERSGQSQTIDVIDVGHKRGGMRWADDVLQKKQEIFNNAGWIWIPVENCLRDTKNAYGHDGNNVGLSFKWSPR